MKKSILVLGILVMAIGAASAQELKPFRISAVGGAMFFGGSGIGFEYALPLSKSTVGFEVQGLYVGNNDLECPWTVLTGVSYYPFSNLGKGFFADIFAHYRFPNDLGQSRALVGTTLGWRWIFLEYVNLGVQVGGDYKFYDAVPFVPDQGSISNDTFMPRVTFTAGIAF
jgi:hypothetical protein